jgi:hypothetical protein
MTFENTQLALPSSMAQSQRKQLRHASRTAASGTAFRDLQQLQVLPPVPMLQPRQQASSEAVVPAALVADSADPQYWHHHHFSGAHLQQQQAAARNLGVGINNSQQGFAGIGNQDSAKDDSTLSKARADDALSPECLLSLCAVLLEEEAELQAAGIHPLLLAALSLIESGGCPAAKQYRDHLDDVALGLCQVMSWLVGWLARSSACAAGCTLAGAQHCAVVSG